MMIQEAATYNFDGSCCCYKNDEETVASGPTLSIARRFGCCCFFHSDHTIVKMEKVSTTRIEKPVDGCALFIAWLFAGCFGWHRFASGRYKSGFAMAIVFTLAFAGVVGFFIAAEDELWNHDWHHPEGYRPHWIDLYTSLTVAGILCAIVFGLVVCLWIFDAFFLLRWSQYVPQTDKRS